MMEVFPMNRVIEQASCPHCGRVGIILADMEIDDSGEQAYKILTWHCKRCGAANAERRLLEGCENEEL